MFSCDMLVAYRIRNIIHDITISETELNMRLLDGMSIPKQHV